MQYDLILKNGRVVDPAHQINEVCDLAISGGKVAAVGHDLDHSQAKRTWDVAGKAVAPGLIDNHMHSTLGPGSRAAFAMLARAGVSTAVDFAGPPGEVFDGVAAYGAGITVASLQVLRPAAAGGRTLFASDADTVLSGPNPNVQSIGTAIDAGLKAGALGTKILGGHFPFTPEATLRIVEETNRRGVYMAFHVGTTETGSDLRGLKEAVGMATPTRRIHLCHISSALRSQVLPSRIEETYQAMTVLAQAKESVISESFLTRWSPDPGLCIDGIPDSAVVRTSLQLGGYEPTEAGLARGIADGHIAVLLPLGDENRYIFGQKALDFWRETNTAASIAFPISFADTGLICATHRRPDGEFTVTALASDAGQLPLNVTINHGLMLVEFGAFMLSDLIFKAAWAPSRMLGLLNKGHLGVGADADVVVIDLERKCPCHLLVGGELVMTEGLVVGSGGTILTTEAGVAAVRARGLPFQVADLSQSMLYAKRDR